MVAILTDDVVGRGALDRPSPSMPSSSTSNSPNGIGTLRTAPSFRSSGTSRRRRWECYVAVRRGRARADTTTRGNTLDAAIIARCRRSSGRRLATDQFRALNDTVPTCLVQADRRLADAKAMASFVCASGNPGTITPVSTETAPTPCRPERKTFANRRYRPPPLNAMALLRSSATLSLRLYHSAEANCVRLSPVRASHTSLHGSGCAAVVQVSAGIPAVLAPGRTAQRSNLERHRYPD